MNRRTHLFAIVFSLGAIFFARSASASPTFPDAVKRALSLSYSPPCALCHEGGRTGAGTVTTPFGRAVRDRGAAAGNDASLIAAVQKIAADKIDSDGDGVTDGEELKHGTDPNSKGGASLDTPEIGYGCGGASIARRNVPIDFGFVVLAGVFVSLLARRRRSIGLAIVAGTATVAIGCYDISFVSTDMCSSGAMWTGIRESELMDPGRACLECHGRGRGPRFTVAGTLYTKIDEADNCTGTSKAKVILLDASGRVIELVPNAAGNFYTRLDVAMPYQAKVVVGDKETQMTAKQDSGDCNSCHSQHGQNAAPGRITPP